LQEKQFLRQEKDCSLVTTSRQKFLTKIYTGLKPREASHNFHRPQKKRQSFTAFAAKILFALETTFIVLKAMEVLLTMCNPQHIISTPSAGLAALCLRRDLLQFASAAWGSSLRNVFLRHLNRFPLNINCSSRAYIRQLS